MKNDFLTHKFLPILSVFLLALLLLCTSCFASDDGHVFSDGKVYPVPPLSLEDGKNYFLVRNLNDSSLSVYYYDSTFKMVKNQQGGSFYFNLFGYDGEMITGNYIHGLTYNSSLELTKDKWTGGIAYQDYLVYSSNVDILDSEGNLVFQVAPQVTPEEPEEVVQVELAPLMTSIEFSAVMSEVLGILPILLAVVIGLLALRKAIKLLSQMLHQA